MKIHSPFMIKLALVCLAGAFLLTLWVGTLVLAGAAEMISALPIALQWMFAFSTIASGLSVVALVAILFGLGIARSGGD